MSNNYYTSMPPVVKNLLMINVLFFMATEFLSADISNTLYRYLGLFYWESPFFMPHQLITYMFLHGGFTHLFANMFALWMFGRIIEYDLGSKKFLIYYMVCGIGAGLLQMGVTWIEVSGMKSAIAAGGYTADAITALGERINGSTVGASGAIFGILLAFGMLHPNSMIMLLIPPIPMKAKYFVIIYGVLELFLGVSGYMGNVAHFAHVGGMLWGFLLLRYWKKKGMIRY